MSGLPDTVCYSWQSDAPGRFNRSFIEDAIKEALENVRKGTALDSSPREPQLEKDTLNVPGSPPITETILRKIDACAVFVADLTIVGQLLPGLSDHGPGKLFPNSNVVMEYGYALKSRGDSRLIAVTNEAFGGEVREASLPYNLRHRRWPIRYRFGPDTPPGDKKQIQSELVKDLTNAIGLILRESPPSHIVSAPFLASNLRPESFAQMAKAHELLIDGPYGQNLDRYEIPPRMVISLRLQPAIQVPEFDSEIDAMEAARRGQLRPMVPYNTSGRSTARNSLGGITFEGPVDGKLFVFSQLFLSREIYGVDARSAGALVVAEGAQPSFDISNVEESFALTLRNYAKFASNTLALPPPWKLQASIYGVKNAQLHPGTRCLKPEIHWIGTMTPGADALDVLDSFFSLVWKSFGARRPPTAQQNLRELVAHLDSTNQ